MKRFFIRIALFGILLFVMDKLVGYTLTYMSENAKGGFVGHYHYLIDRTNEEMLIFGSSRAIHHYNPSILEEALGVSCYNCGQEGSGIIQNYGFWSIISEHYHPKYVLYDVMDDFDLLVGEDNHKYLGWLKESYDKGKVADIFESVDKTEKIKMTSQMYRYNSKWHQIIGDYIYPVYKVQAKGYLPLEGEIDTMKINRNYKNDKSFVFDELKINYLKKMVSEMGDTKLVFIVSPLWYGISSSHFKPIVDICNENDITFLNYANDAEFVHNNSLFKDGVHLNSLGADSFTKKLIKDLKL